MQDFTKTLLLGSVVVVGLAGTISALTINTTPAQHNAYLRRLGLGGTGSETQIRKVDRPNERVVLSGNLIVGDTSNNAIGATVKNAIIAGGSSNKINGSSDNSIIGAGNANKMSASNAMIGAGDWNAIEPNGNNSFIGWWGWNKISATWSSIGGWENNIIAAENSTIPGGTNNSIDAGAKNSFAAGIWTKVTKEGTFAWNDGTSWSLSPQKTGTFLVQAQNGMTINTDDIQPGVTVNINGSVEIDGTLGTYKRECNDDEYGTFNSIGGCFYYCDGDYRQLLDAAYYETGTNRPTCKHISRCYFDGIWLREWDNVTIYKKPRSKSCETSAEKQIWECEDGKQGDFENIYSYCMPYDDTSIDIIENHNPLKRWW